MIFSLRNDDFFVPAYLSEIILAENSKPGSAKDEYAEQYTNDHDEVHDHFCTRETFVFCPECIVRSLILVHFNKAKVSINLEGYCKIFGLLNYLSSIVSIIY